MYDVISVRTMCDIIGESKAPFVMSPENTMCDAVPESTTCYVIQGSIMCGAIS